jgi:gas vesicle protein
MTKLYLILSMLAAIPVMAGADELSKEQKKEIKTQLKAYIKDPAAYRNTMERYNNSIDTLQALTHQQKTTINQLSTRVSELQTEMNNADKELQDCQSKPSTKCPECPTMTAVPATGTVYKVQMGLYSKLDLSGYFNKPKSIGYEKVEGMNRYVIGYFEQEDEAKEMVKDLRKMGIKDAFAAKYEGGKRIFEWNKNPKYKGKQAPTSIEAAVADDKLVKKKGKKKAKSGLTFQ